MTEGIQRLLDIMARLRDPKGGCPWDVEQTFASIAPHTIEEAYEVVEAIEQGDMDAFRDELGDLLLQVVFHAQMAREAGRFDFADVVTAISDKLVRRHPHVFGDAVVKDAEDQLRAWESLKAGERSSADASPRTSADASPRTSALDGVATSLPALTRSAKLGARAARVGFDWTDPWPVVDKIVEELDELKAEMAPGADPERMVDEMGDLLFACVTLARKLKIDPETALRRSNATFERRFRRIEEWLAESGRTPDQSSLEEMDALWTRAKIEQRGGTP
ncbi:MAG: nucleoside triphosphate pyrophosphohydrolase [Alphaproteobacteria bacterium]|nr:nucleoside triphosphate pyrophosphohydrolase [Alphaproteobacteria bacterium]MBF0129235.1 nucleoside triphosphate pyrophosphohydrolase [Alphaproteobacteria bacterium]